MKRIAPPRVWAFVYGLLKNKKEAYKVYICPRVAQTVRQRFHYESHIVLHFFSLYTSEIHKREEAYGDAK